MKARAHLTNLILFPTLAFALALLLFSAWNRHVVNEAHRILQKQGIRTRLSQFDFSVPADFEKRGQAVLRADFGLDHIVGAEVRWPVVRLATTLHPNNSNSVVAIWKKQSHDVDESAWRAVRRTLDEHGAEVDAGRKAVLDGPIGFMTDWKSGYAVLIPHIHALPKVALTFGVATLADLHDGQFEKAWTNLLATTRTLTAWRAEPTAWAQNARFQLMKTIFAVSWQALQSHWSDGQLAMLEAEWRGINFFDPLPQMVEYDGACIADAIQRMLHEPTEPPFTIREMIDAPRRIPIFVDDRFRSFSFRWRGSYDDQRDVLFYFRDRRAEVSRALEEQTFAEMLPLPGMTNAMPFKSRHRSWALSLVNLERFSIQTQKPNRMALGWVGMAAESEIRRRIFLAVIALERHRLRDGEYPRSLDQLVPLGDVLVDFADGKPLRYRRTEDGHFLLYSVGLDCVDNGGVAIDAPIPGAPMNYGIQFGQDLVWPLPKT